MHGVNIIIWLHHLLRYVMFHASTHLLLGQVLLAYFVLDFQCYAQPLISFSVAAAGECEGNPGWMQQNCGPACGNCN